jgi:aldehyde:ferredoxin oxidoreductase
LDIRTMPPHGYHGQYLRVDLSARSAKVVEIPPDVFRRFVGGAGLATWLLHREAVDSQDPLSPAAPIVFAFSPLVGTPLTTSAKFAIVSQSPLTGMLNDSLSSSHFAIAGKKTGHDAIVLVGAADEWMAVAIEPDAVRFLSAERFVGLSARTAGDDLRRELGPGFRVAAIGPAGENLVRYATVSHDGRHAGRGGTGAVFGSKRLKAVAVRGDRSATVADPQGLVAYSRELSKKSFGPATEKYRELGTIGNLLTLNRLGALPTRNFQATTFEGAAGFAPETLDAAFAKTRESCAACTIGCEHIYQLADSRGVRMEYENVFALGPLCGVSEPRLVLEASALCDELGLDTISAGGTIAFAMECAERGYLADARLRFGHGEGVLDLLRDISARQGIGALLAEGSRRASLEIGRDSADFAPHVKGLEIPGYDPRSLQLMALGFAVGTRGADHNRSGAYQVDLSMEADRLNARVEDVSLAIRTENEAALFDSLILCKFLRGVFEDRLAALAEMLHLVTGWDTTPGELTGIAERIVTARKRFNVRQGWRPELDTLPRRFLTKGLPDGAGQGATLTEARLGALVREYNRLRGWSPEGWPPQPKRDGSGSSAEP